MKKITIEHIREELLYDIKNLAFVEGDVMRTEDEHARHQVMDVGEDGNIDAVTRWLDLAHSECVEALYAYSKREVVPDNSSDDTLHETIRYTLEMNVPDTFSETTQTYLTRLIHEFMVYRVLFSWFMISYPEKASVHKARGDELLDKIKSAKGRMPPITYRKSHPW